ncbi:MAG: hypothetical protein WD398_06875 [Cyclobacteriaceae bacterium]
MKILPNTLHWLKSGKAGIGLLFPAILVIGIFISCEDTLMEEVLVYDNDFSGEDLTGFENGKFHVFNGDTVLGYFNDEKFKLDLSGLPPHNTIKVTINLLLHDSWDGNSDNVGGPDFWYLDMDGKNILRTTFSNSPCESLYCLYQSFPNNYPRLHKPKTGNADTGLPGRCQYAQIPGWTTRYRISKIISHSSSALELVCGDALKQENAANPECDESWSVERIQVSTMTVN